MISREEIDRLRSRLREALREDVHNTERLLARVGSLARESGVGPHGAVLLGLTRLSFEESDAKRHWEGILEHRRALGRALNRDVGLRVAVLDYFTNVNRQLLEPTRIDLEMFPWDGPGAGLDRLTGLAADRQFRAALQNELRRARRYRQKVALVLLDLDDFAHAAAEIGDLVADRLLREAAMVLHNKIRDIDVAARPGEDEFALVLPQTDRNGALLVAERIRREIAAYFLGREAGGKSVELTVSAGVAAYPDDALAPSELLERAAQALYRAKACGKNAVLAYHPERRRYLRFELEPGRFEVEVLSPPGGGNGRIRNLSRSGIVFSSPEALGLGEEIEIRVVDAGEDPGLRPLRIRGRVVRLEELPPAEPDERSLAPEDRYEIGVALDPGTPDGELDLADFLERALLRGPGAAG